MKILPVVVGPFEVNCYIVEGIPRNFLVIDPGADEERIEALLPPDARVAAYLLTHGHADHVGALASLHARHPAPILMHPADLEWCFSPSNQIPPFYSPPQHPAAEFISVDDGTLYDYAGLSINVISTPGHSPGSVCYHIPSDSVVFCGDTLFAGSVGRTDIPRGDPRMLRRSLHGLVSKLAPATRVYPGHGPSTSMAAELARNVFLKSSRP